MGRPLERICKRGHDTHEVGRIRKGWCKACALASDAAGGGQGKQVPRYSLEWTRARVARWLEIVADDPIDVPAQTAARKREFEARCARLEADLPTPTEVKA